MGAVGGIPVLGLDALSSAAYGPEAALTLLIPLGAAGLRFVTPITGLIVAILGIVYVSYRQTIARIPAAAAPLNVAVGISAGVGALVSAFPVLPRIRFPCASASSRSSRW